MRVKKKNIQRKKRDFNTIIWEFQQHIDEAIGLPSRAWKRSMDQHDF